MGNKVSILLSLEGNAQNKMLDLMVNAEKTGVALDKAKEKMKNYSDALSKGANYSMIFEGLANSLSRVQSATKDLTSAFMKQQQVETQLATIMGNTMGATEAEVQAIKDLCSAQQELGVIGDEVQLAGAQELATYLELSSSLETLIPVMNDMAAQQYGLEASSESVASIATMLGKVMQGQTTALSRLGYSFTDAEKNVLQFGTEEERAAVLADVVNQSVKGVNAALAQTDAGKVVQMNNALGDGKEILGSYTVSLQPVIDMTTEFASSMVAVAMGTNAVMSLVPTMITGYAALANVIAKAKVSMFAYYETTIKTTASLVAQRVALLAQQTAQMAVIAATRIWQGVQIVMNGILTMNPIGIVVTAIGALVAIIVAAYNNCDTFRNICDKVWAGLKKVGAVVWDALVSAFETASKAIPKAWEWLKEFLGLDDKKVVETEVKQSSKGGNVVNDEGEKQRAADEMSYKELSDAIEKNNKSLKELAPTETAEINRLKSLNAELEKRKTTLGQVLGIETQSTKKNDKGKPEGSLADIKDKISKVEAQIETTVDYRELTELGTRLKELQNKKELLEFKVEVATNGTEKLKTLPAALPEMSIKFDSKQLAKDTATVTSNLKKMNDSMTTVTKTEKQGITVAKSMANSFSEIGSAIGGTAGAMLSWAADTASAVAQVIAQIIALIPAQEASSIAGATSSSASLPFPANIAAIGASIAAVIAAFAKMPAFAEGGIITGPTIGLMGEYAGAMNNPEVVAPLNKLRGIIEESNGLNGTVKFKMVGRALEGVLIKEERRRSRN